ncbi:tyrosine-protein phosphatase [Microbacterium sp. A84]|uniref:tyrosine-protein phosphatase n=1 Tax=Microbacterium sp. A84 TaxID=3450715 RepID=UPI003F42E34C
MTGSGIEGLYNFRDTGGMPLQGGGVTRSGVLFRSDALASLTPSGLDALAATDIGVIVDFRTLSERTVAPDRIPASRPIRVIELPILQGAMADMAQQLVPNDSSPASPAAPAAPAAPASFEVPTLGDLYTGMLEQSATAFVQVARLIAASNDASPSAVLVHCTAGKDRTGLTTALMLDAAGVERGAVVDDYAISQENLAGPWADAMIHMVTSYGVELTPALRALVTGTPPEAIEQALTWVDDRDGDSAGYLRSAGLTADELSMLRARLAA